MARARRRADRAVSAGVYAIRPGETLLVIEWGDGERRWYSPDAYGLALRSARAYWRLWNRCRDRAIETAVGI